MSAILVLPITAFVLTSIYRAGVERNFDARLNVYLTSLVASTTQGGQVEPKESTNLGEPALSVITRLARYAPGASLRPAMRPLKTTARNELQLRGRRAGLRAPAHRAGPAAGLADDAH